MSYLDLPRLHFAGSFQAAPSTVNNTPNNYPEGVPPGQVELYWNPKGTGIFDLVDCTVTALVGPDGALVTSADRDPLIGQPITASYTKAPPKLVDLDPMQQNTSEIWGLLLQVGDLTDRTTGNVRGAYTEGPFGGIWGQAQGPDAPHSSASGSAYYQSTLEHLAWQPPQSGFLQELQARSGERLSIRMIVRAHNNAPPNYDFSPTGLQKLRDAGMPASLVDALEPMSLLIQNVGDTPGIIPTASYVNSLLAEYLGPQVAQANGSQILQTTAVLPYKGATRYDFCYGQIFGTIGPSHADEPTYMTPTRVLAPPQGSPCFFAPATVAADAPRLTVDLGNSLPTVMPGDPPDPAVLHTLTLGWLDDSGTFTTTTPPTTIDYSTLVPTRAGIVDLTLAPDVIETIRDRQLVLAAVDEQGKATTLLSENPGGFYMLADRFVFRMNPGIPTTSATPRGETATGQIYVTRFGQPLANTAVSLTMLTEAQALAYTKNTLGTSGTRGLGNLSIPTSALQFTTTTTTNEQGVASFELMASDPGDPRGALDGQIYFLRYQFQTPTPAPYVQGPDELVSVQVYQQSTTSDLTWYGSIREILSQYGMLYPIMSNIGLSDYASVVRNHEMIETVLSRDILDPLHMPVTRDLSDSRRQLVLQWFAAGMPEGTPPTS